MTEKSYCSFWGWRGKKNSILRLYLEERSKGFRISQLHNSKIYPWDLPKILHVIWTREEEGISIYEGSQWKDHCQTGRINKHFHHVNVKLEWRATSIHEDFTCLFHFHNRIYLLSENSDESLQNGFKYLFILTKTNFYSHNQRITY